MRKKVVGYTRVSTEEQMSNFSLGFQADVIKKYCKQHDMDLVHIYEEAGTGTSYKQRPHFLEMMQTVLQSETITHIIVAMDDRFARNHAEAVSLVDTLKKRNKYLVCIADNINTENPEHLPFFQMKSVFAEAARNRIVFNVVFGMEQRAMKGLFTGGRVTGYDSVNKRLLVNEKEKKIVVEIFERYAKSRWGYRKIAIHLNRLGYKTINGNEWTIFAVKNILTNVLYTGKVLYKGEIYPGKHEPLIEPQLWERTQRELQKNSTITHTKNVGSHYLSGLVRCPDCQGSMVHHKQGKYSYYQCSNNKNGKSCKANLVPQSKIESSVLQDLNKLVNSSSLRSVLSVKISSELKLELKSCVKAIQAEKNELKSLSKKVEKTFELLYREESEIYNQQLHKLHDKIQDTEKRLKIQEEKLSVLKNQDENTILQGLFNNFVELFQSLENDKKVELVRSIFKKIEINQGEKPRERNVRSISTHFDVEDIGNLITLEL